MSLDLAHERNEIGDMCCNQHDIHLRRIDPALNMRRFYSLILQPTLFGGSSVVRNWGRIGTSGQAMIETFDEPNQAFVALKQLETLKRLRGYQIADTDGSAKGA